jgi:predicted HD superfamily hydrolase involved in NAD metabolism
LSLEDAANWVRPRVSDKRFEHIRGVAQTARQLAISVGSDEYLAELAGWLHDACKEMKDKELVSEAKKFGLKLSALEKKNGHLLHGPVAAQVVRRELGLKNEDLLKAIAEHTLGAVEMSLLSKVVFLADALEPGRPSQYTEPIRNALGNCHSGKPDIDLDKAVVTALDLNLAHLLDTGRVIHPRTVEVRNYYLEVVNERKTS